MSYQETFQHYTDKGYALLSVHSLDNSPDPVSAATYSSWVLSELSKKAAHYESIGYATKTIVLKSERIIAAFIKKVL